MKTMRTLVAIFTAMFVANLASASGNLKVDFTSNDAKLTTVEISNAELSNFEISVKDAYGVELYSMETEAPKEEFKKRYDFSELENGTYWYTVKIDNEKITKQFEIDNGEVKVLNIRKDVEPYFTKQGDMLKISKLNFQNEDVKLYVYDQRNNSLLNETSLGNDSAIHKAVDLSELRNGSYNVVIANSAEIYEYNVKVE